MNIFKSKKFIATALTLVLVMTLVGLPLSAKDRRGATVEVTMTDGRSVKGELLAVKTETLLIYDRDARQGKSIDLQQVAQVKVLKKSKFFQGLAIGLGYGVVLSALYCVTLGQDQDLAGLMFLYLSPYTCMIGGGFGAVAGRPKKISLAGESSRRVQQNLEKLKLYAREQDAEKVVAD